MVRNQLPAQLVNYVHIYVLFFFSLAPFLFAYIDFRREPVFTWLHVKKKMGRSFTCTRAERKLGLIHHGEMVYRAVYREMIFSFVSPFRVLRSFRFT